MKFSYKLIGFLLLASIDLSISDESDQLLFVHALWRHGDRAPLGTWPKDNYTEDWWWKNYRLQGWGELSPTGMAQHYTLGRKLAQRYIFDQKFLDPTYNAKQIYIRADNYNRTMISAYSNLLGMFKDQEVNQTGNIRDYPTESQWLTGYVPIPVHIQSYAADSCPRDDKLADLVRQTPEYQSLVNNQTTKDNLLKLANLTGWDVVHLDTLTHIQDNLFIEHWAYSLNVSEGFMDMMDWLNNTANLLHDWQNGLQLQPYQGIDFSVEIPKIDEGGGIFLWSVINLFQDVIDCQNKTSPSVCSWLSTLRYYVYSAHDSTLEALAAALGFKLTNYDINGIPQYSAAVTFELWMNVTSKVPYIKLLHWPKDQSSYTDITAQISNCTANCTFDQFKARSQPFKAGEDNDINKWCQMPLFPNSTSSTSPTPTGGSTNITTPKNDPPPTGAGNVAYPSVLSFVILCLGLILDRNF